jgi:hypothetical protein
VEAIELQAHSEWSVTAFEFPGIGLVAVDLISIAVIEQRRGPIVG